VKERVSLSESRRLSLSKCEREREREGGAMSERGKTKDGK